MKRILCTCLFAAASGASLITATAQSTASASKPNILFILADDHRTDGIAALGNRHLKTPVLDKLVERGVAFSDRKSTRLNSSHRL